MCDLYSDKQFIVATMYDLYSNSLLQPCVIFHKQFIVATMYDLCSNSLLQPRMIFRKQFIVATMYDLYSDKLRRAFQKEFRRKAGSDDNQINVEELTRALNDCASQNDGYIRHDCASTTDI
jgi:hypothetical protein